MVMVMVMVMNDLLPPICAMLIGPPIQRYSYFKIWPWKSMGKVMCVVKGEGHVWPSKFKAQSYGQGQNHWSHLRPGVQSICLLFVSWHMDHFWLRYRKFHIDLENPWSRSRPRSNLMVISEALEFNRFVCFSFRGNRAIFGWDIANSIFDLENSRSTSGPRSNPKVTFELRFQSICLLFVLWQSDHFWLRYSKFHIWPWKI